MMFPGAGGPELERIASTKVQRDVTKFFTYAVLIEAGIFF